ncbi:MAG: hypothetical protein A3G45_02835 [Candidatus Staskawiczbacteria bacterium RIFCSPLOWO2_12_FULL_37_15]|uniref:Uncharacterized protein n=1 Tax=Candidatus Staskawiczbacteria bacterium RIFCSPLOWO2_12_FULL_37_15 TaxID=1802218 RepID=A0A1G2ILG6_9BACT|nr:MAG: hypothetical protein US35_C0014G0008 [Parcubacteria group bacterium GW2011_GWA2_37_10]OGZ75351.1 MAG: hypothetical protein A3G45_02835 [Candidatus Staskawiczbacteria bacterium RIFCSPLOWO2_12_FULL_37_15]
MPNPERNEPNPEKEKVLDLNILCLDSCITVDDMIAKVQAARNEGKIDTVWKNILLKLKKF